MKRTKKRFCLFVIVALVGMCSCSKNACDPVESESTTFVPIVCEPVRPFFEAVVCELGKLEFSPVRKEVEQIKMEGEWKYVDHNGDVLPYDWMRGFRDRLFCIVVKDDKWGVVNADFDIVVPVEYANIVRAYQFTGDQIELTDWLLYAQKDGHWYSIDLQKGIIVSFFRNETKKTNYSYFYDDFDILICDGKVQNVEYFGNRTELHVEMFLPAFDGETFSLLRDGEVIYAKASLEKGPYEDEVMFTFNDISAHDFYTVSYRGMYESFDEEIDISLFVDANHAHVDKYYIIYSGFNRKKEICMIYVVEDKYHSWLFYEQFNEGMFERS